MPRLSVIVRGGLQELLPRSMRSPIPVDAPPGATARAVVEDLGIPHTEIGCVLINGHAASPSSRPADGDTLIVHHVAREADPAGAPPRFVVDVHLGRLARLLRLLGFDTAWSRDADDDTLAGTSSREDRILLSRDRGLLKRREVRRGYLVRSQVPRAQLDEVADRFGLRDRLSPFSRCMICNAPLVRGGPANVGPGGAEAGDPTGGCPACGRRYWRGSHWKSLNSIVEGVRNGAVRRPRVTSG